MTCPFLREAQVKYCATAAVRKLIPLAQSGHAHEKCGSNAHATCSLFQAQAESDGSTPPGPCRFLSESLMQYCAAAPVTRFVPYSEVLLSRCGNDSFRYCEVYLSAAPPHRSKNGDTIEAPPGLRYSANHMWVDVGGDGVCHVGVDAFLSRVLGPIEHLTFVQYKGYTRPAAVLTAAGVDLEVVFPNSFLLTGCNIYLRANPSRITREPYTAGWLFEGRPSPELLENLLEGESARGWMAREQQRLSQFLEQERLAQGSTMADGGTFIPGLAHRLERDRLRVLFHRFFSPYANEKRV